ncbi:MAG: CYTH domain-containing protein [Desulfocapsaceae bacterium]|nr:CYTH domain-containing protein [Desulfocapsaceae bacterium]
MGKEIERKFLLAGDEWRKNARGHVFRQGYIGSRPGRTVRVRTCNNTGFLTLKGKSSGITRLEFEYPIPLSDANTLLAELCEQPLVEKIRYLVDYEGFRWEIDEFLGDNAGLCIAEIELSAEDQPFPRPPWLGEEVSGDIRYYNSNLRENPFKNWKKQ